MPVVVMHGGGGGGYVGGGKNARPNSHLCLSIITSLVNPIFGLNHAAVARGFSVGRGLEGVRSGAETSLQQDSGSALSEIMFNIKISEFQQAGGGSFSSYTKDLQCHSVTFFVTINKEGYPFRGLVEFSHRICPNFTNKLGIQCSKSQLSCGLATFSRLSYHFPFQ